jgi:hypothetical protein
VTRGPVDLSGLPPGCRWQLGEEPAGRFFAWVLLPGTDAWQTTAFHPTPQAAVDEGAAVLRRWRASRGEATPAPAGHEAEPAMQGGLF